MISVLLNIVPDEGHEARLQAALALIESQGGHITVSRRSLCSPLHRTRLWPGVKSKA